MQYTRNTVSGASTAQLVILLVDARKGVIEQTRRHAAVLALLGVPRLVLAVNKIDLVADSARIFEAISAEFNELTSSLGWKPENVVEIPVSALHGDNIATRSERTGFYSGPTLIEYLESIPAHEESSTVGLRFPVQYVIRPRTAEYPDYRGYAGQVAAGVVRVGDEVVISPAGQRTTVAGIDTADGPLEVAEAGRSVTLILADDVDASRGDLIAAPDVSEPVSEIEGTVCWLADKPLTAGARLLLKHGTRTVPAIVGELVERFDEQNLSADPAPESLKLNDIGQISIRLAEAISVDEYVDDRTAGSFLLIDPSSGNTLAAGLVGDALRAVELNRA